MREVPVDYDRVYLEMARRGARVLALGHRRLGNLSHQDVSKCLSLYKLPLWVYKKTGLSDNLKLQLVATKSGKIHYVIMDNVIWTNQNELSVYLCQHAYVLFDETCYPAFLRALDVISSVCRYINCIFLQKISLKTEAIENTYHSYDVI